ncbi:hypothetical protein JNW91_28850 [Micromonospora sp. STR1_7]|uniref:Uncharacterized protein n=1 Tax=Micromonospora parastrephiae TaxID=2806101 RepID=A0ABS1Y1P8_9ACTN|nr:hypothetical protein [Micromonospora parastrephiae]MBM0235437.1 hypothetical protein [Micromonospora parastrephiae]
MKFVLLIFSGGVGVPVAVLLIARALVERHADQHGAAIRAAGDLPSRREAAQRPARPKEMAR